MSLGEIKDNASTKWQKWDSNPNLSDSTTKALRAQTALVIINIQLPLVHVNQTTFYAMDSDHIS